MELIEKGSIWCEHIKERGLGIWQIEDDNGFYSIRGFDFCPYCAKPRPEEKKQKKLKDLMMDKYSDITGYEKHTLSDRAFENDCSVAISAFKELIEKCQPMADGSTISKNELLKRLNDL